MEIMTLLKKIAQPPESSNRPKAVLFDIDSTLLWNTKRHLAIIHEFGRRENLQPLLNLKIEQVEDWFLDRTFQKSGLSDAEVRSILPRYMPFWQERFFSSQFCDYDAPIRGAVEFVQWVSRAGATILYCSGRHLEMGEATINSLRNFGFPADEPKAQWYLKPRFEMIDLDFKIATAERISREWNVVAAFENEPEQLDKMSSHLPDAIHVLLETNCRDPHYALKNIHPLRVKDFASFL